VKENMIASKGNIPVGTLLQGTGSKKLMPGFGWSMDAIVNLVLALSVFPVFPFLLRMFWGEDKKVRKGFIRSLGLISQLHGIWRRKGTYGILYLHHFLFPSS
jgi:hypothetical protein